MPEYRRPRQPGGTFFFTVNLADRRRTWLVDHVQLLREAVASVQSARPFTIEASVILPGHLHMIWSLPQGDGDFSTRWRLIKGRFSHDLPITVEPNDSKHRKRERGVWQRRFYDHLIRDEADFAAHADYIHFNPVKHGLVDRPVDWPYSSIHRYIRRGILTSDWGTSNPPADMDLQ